MVWTLDVALTQGIEEKDLTSELELAALVSKQM